MTGQKHAAVAVKYISGPRRTFFEHSHMRLLESKAEVRERGGKGSKADRRFLGYFRDKADENLRYQNGDSHASE